MQRERNETFSVAIYKTVQTAFEKIAASCRRVCAIFLAAEGFDLYEDYAQYRMETDPAFAQHHDRALSILHSRGYEVHDSDTDLHWARPVLEFEAYKGSLEYKIVMSYPDLNIIEERVDL